MNVNRPRRVASPARFADLPLGGQLSLWAVRLWASAESGHPALHRTIRTGFALIDLPSAYAALNAFLSMVTHGDRSLFRRCRCNDPLVTADEGRFLACLAEQQQGAVVAAYWRLRTWTGSAAARAAMAASLDYALVLSARNLPVGAGRASDTDTHSSVHCARGCGEPNCRGQGRRRPDK